TIHRSGTDKTGPAKIAQPRRHVVHTEEPSLQLLPEAVRQHAFQSVDQALPGLSTTVLRAADTVSTTMPACRSQAHVVSAAATAHCCRDLSSARSSMRAC